jgi:hypothetical protein
MHFRYKTIIGTTLLFLLAALTFAYAAPSKRFDEGSQTCRVLTDPIKYQGYKVFRNSCKTCHYRGNDKGATFLYTESKSMAGWNKVFSKKYPACARDGSWDSISEDDLLALNDFLFAKAYDAYDPNDAQDCG